MTIRIIAIILSLLFVVSCANIITPQNPKETYLVALTEYNNLLELYVKNKASIDDADLKAEVKGYFMAASDALDAWEMALMMGDDTYKNQITTSQLMSKLMDVIFKVMEQTK